MAQTRRNRKLGRWARETARRETGLDEVPSQAVRRISLPEHDVPLSQLPISAESGALAKRIQDLQRRLRRARWIPWQRRNRPALRAEIEDLTRQWRALRVQRSGRDARRASGP